MKGERIMKAKPELSKSDVAGGVTTLASLLRKREEIGKEMDRVIDILGGLYGELSKLNRDLSRHNEVCAGGPPQWISETWSAEILRNRLAQEVAEHSTGGARQSVQGDVHWVHSLEDAFKKNHVALAGR